MPAPASIFAPREGKQQRTRSQLTIPDLFSKVALHRSPLKVARSALRNQSVNIPTLPAVSKRVHNHTNDCKGAGHETALTPCKRKRLADQDCDATREHKIPRNHARLPPSPAVPPPSSATTEKFNENQAFIQPARKVYSFGNQAASSSGGERVPSTVPLLRTASAFEFSTPGAPGVPRLDLNKFVVGTPRKEASPLNLGMMQHALARDVIPDTEEGGPHVVPLSFHITKVKTDEDIIDISGFLIPTASSTPPSETPTTLRTAIHAFLPPSVADMGSPLTPVPPTPYPSKVIREEVHGQPVALRSKLEAVKPDGERTDAKDVYLTPGPNSSIFVRSRTTSQSSRLPRPVSGLMLPPVRPVPTTDPPAPNAPVPPATTAIHSHIQTKTNPRAPKPQTLSVQAPRVTRSVSRGMKVRNDSAHSEGQRHIVATSRKRGVNAGKKLDAVDGSGPGIAPKARFGNVSSKEACFTFAVPCGNLAVPKTPRSLSKMPMSSPSKLNSPPRKQYLASRSPLPTPTTSPVKLQTPASKLMRSASMFSTTSTLSTLSSALEKLALPPPKRSEILRPSTSLGFNANGCTMSPPSLPEAKKERSQDDGAVGLKLPDGSKVDSGAGREGGLGGTVNTPERSKTAVPSLNDCVDERVSVALNRAGADRVRRTLGVRREATLRKFGFGMRVGEKASKRSALPSIAGSPVKARDAPEENGEELHIPVRKEEQGDHTKGGSSSGSVGNIMTDKLDRTSRRASLASQALSQSLKAPPEGRSCTHSQGKSIVSPTTHQSGTTTNGPSALMNESTGGGGLVQADDSCRNKESDAIKKVLGGCTIFLDVRSQEGDEAGSLFAEMCSQMGAKILQRVGQSCTHIVFKNGLMSTITRYRLLKDPKPVVVSIAWVVDVAEQRMKLEETRYKVDLEGTNVAGFNKRRRSVLPRQVPIYEAVRSPISTFDLNVGDDSVGQSMESSSSVLLDEDDLPPLEKARLRRLTAAH